MEKKVYCRESVLAKLLQHCLGLSILLVEEVSMARRRDSVTPEAVEAYREGNHLANFHNTDDEEAAESHQ